MLEDLAQATGPLGKPSAAALPCVLSAIFRLGCCTSGAIFILRIGCTVSFPIRKHFTGSMMHVGLKYFVFLTCMAFLASALGAKVLVKSEDHSTAELSCFLHWCYIEYLH